MEPLIQKPTDCKPKVIFEPNGNLLIQGRSFGENPYNYFDPMVQFINNIRKKEVIMDIRMDYLNTASSKCLYEVIIALEENERIHRAEVRWHYEADDEEMQETGEIYAEMCEKVLFVHMPIEVNTNSFSL